MISATAFRRGRVHANMLVEIEHFLRANPLGTVDGTTGVRIGESPDSVREVASTYWSKEKIPLGEEVIGYPPMPPDLVIEILSSSSNFAQMRETIREYFTSGIHIV